MKCDYPIEVLSAYLDQELDEKELAQIEAHLKTCACCQATIKELAGLDEKIRTREIEEPSREFIFNLNPRILEKIKTKPRFSVFRYVPVLVPVAVAALVLVIVLKTKEPMRMVSTSDRSSYGKEKTEAPAETKKEVPAGSKGQPTPGPLEATVPRVASKTNTKHLPQAEAKTDATDREPVRTAAGVPRTVPTSNEPSPAAIETLAAASEKSAEAVEYERDALKQIEIAQERGVKRVSTALTKTGQSQGIIVTMVRDAAGKTIKITVTDDTLVTN